MSVTGWMLALIVAAPGQLFITENGTGSVLEFSEGGDFSEAERFATGLSTPLAICRGPDAEIYVAESGSGEITIITEGGDFTDATPFAFGPFSPTGLWCDDDSVYVTDAALGVVADVTLGGDLLVSGSLFATSVELPGELVRDGEGRLFTVGGDIYEVTEGGDYAEAEPFVTGRPLVPMIVSDTALLAGDAGVPEIVDVTEGGDVAQAEPWAVLPLQGETGGIRGLVDARELGMFAAVEDRIYEVSTGGDLTEAEPFATGVQTIGIAYGGMLHHRCDVNADCDDLDACNGVEVCIDNDCVGPENFDCDDDDVCTVDTCDADEGCAHESIDGCCIDDLDCAVDEVCDAESNECAPLGVPTTGEPGDDNDGSESDGGGAGTGGGDDDDDDDVDDGAPADDDDVGEASGASDDGTDAGADDGADGCGCRGNPSPTPGMLVFTVLIMIARRRS